MIDPALTRLVEQIKTAAFRAIMPDGQCPLCGATLTVTTAPHRPAATSGPNTPTEKQVAFYRRLVESPVFGEEERRRALEWLATKATRHTIKDQIDWLKGQVESRRHARV